MLRVSGARGWLFPRSPARPGPRGDEMRREVLVPLAASSSPPSRLATVAYHQIHVTAPCAEGDTADDAAAAK